MKSQEELHERELRHHVEATAGPGGRDVAAADAAGVLIAEFEEEVGEVMHEVVLGTSLRLLESRETFAVTTLHLDDEVVERLHLDVAAR